MAEELTRASHEPHTNLAGFKTNIYTMATQPLDTIPEETQTPPNSPVRVTADPPKTKSATEKEPRPSGFWQTTGRTQPPGKGS